MSEHILRAFEAYRGEGDAYFPAPGFKADLRAIASNLDMAARLLTEYYGLTQLTDEMIPLKWLKTAAEFTWYMSTDPNAPNPLVEVTKEFAGDLRYAVIPTLWAAWFAPGVAGLTGAAVNDFSWLGPEMPTGPEHDSHGHGLYMGRWTCLSE